jgi:hypothetical protein
LQKISALLDYHEGNRSACTRRSCRKGLPMKKRTAVEVTMMLAAQQLVDRWLRSPGRGPFNRAVARELLEHWNDPSVTPVHRRAFGRIANAIRVGEGHAIANPAPLLRMARQMMQDPLHRRDAPESERGGGRPTPNGNPPGLRTSHPR